MDAVKIKKMRPSAVVPKRATPGSAGADLCAATDEPLELKPGQSAVVPTGIAIALPGSEYVALVFPRSGLAVKHGIGMLNSVGVIDSDYRGEISVGLVNRSQQAYTITPGERIAQMLIMPVCLPELKEVEQLDQTERGAGGFGSTGR